MTLDEIHRWITDRTAVAEASVEFAATWLQHFGHDTPDKLLLFFARHGSAVMARHRCGNRDDYDSAQTAPWSRSQLNYFIESRVPGLSADDFDAVVRTGWDKWQEAADVTLTQVSSASRADILIAGMPIDGPGSILGETEMPPGDDRPIHLWLDSTDIWTKALPSADQRAILIQNVFDHEAGHALGLVHSQYRTALMFPYYAPAIVFPQQQDDIPMLQSLFGRPRQPSPVPAPVPSPMPVPLPVPVPLPSPSPSGGFMSTILQTLFKLLGPLILPMIIKAIEDWLKSLTPAQAAAHAAELRAIREELERAA